ncbi:Gfo/Idh/MocA family protein [Paenibacillus allorhizosphaerae]|uniref:Myo-inositol 2-dehydrogenase n=1 Tax=Paenibacillus allorhizosphaerae TaxID=2849866 RepID=A0ABM8VAL1_9BACL|nr:Gfo/Idh/MocA family oxidoreductase [Paenibacillus allorhizosphaerae]CAG7616692.1 Myo-inositol 2-dehydrogenase [Paenibacillus allorhizosphaerae]
MTLKIGFIGTGGIAKNHLSNLAKMEGVTVSSFCDIALERAEQAARQWPHAKAFTRIADMLDDQKLDGVYICIPPMAHGEAEESLTERGIPFLVEKPLGIDQELPDRIVELIKAKSLTTSVGFHWRYHDSTRKARQLLAESEAGMALGYWMGGMPMVTWWRVQQGSGGQFVEQTTHITDLLRYLCGDVVEVYAAYGHRVMQRKVEGTDVADVGTVTMKLHNGMVATVSNTCLLPVGHHVGLDVYTDQGILEIRGGNLKEIRKDRVTEYKGSTNAYFAEDVAFLDAIRTGDASGILSTYEDAIKTHKVTVAANESAVTGHPVKL